MLVSVQRIQRLIHLAAPDRQFDHGIRVACRSTGAQFYGQADTVNGYGNPPKADTSFEGFANAKAGAVEQNDRGQGKCSVESFSRFANS